MSVPPRCLTCGMPISDKIEIFKYYLGKKIDKIAKEFNIKKMDIQLLSGIDLSMKDILDDMKIEGMCCRTALIGFIGFFESMFSDYE